MRLHQIQMLCRQDGILLEQLAIGRHGTGRIFDIKQQQRAAAVDLKVEISIPTRRLQEAFDAAITTGDLLILRAAARTN